METVIVVRARAGQPSLHALGRKAGEDEQGRKRLPHSTLRLVLDESHDRLAPGEKPHGKQMIALACVFDAVPAPRRPHDVIAVAFDHGEARDPRHAGTGGVRGSGLAAIGPGCPPYRDRVRVRGSGSS